jgi:hypothetical protein
VGLALKLAAWSYGRLADLVVERLGITDLEAWRADYDRLTERMIREEETEYPGLALPCRVA